MGNQTFCNCVTCHNKIEKSIDIEKIIHNVEKGTNRGILSNSNRNINSKKNSNNLKDEQIVTNYISINKTISNSLNKSKENEIVHNNNNKLNYDNNKLKNNEISNNNNHLFHSETSLHNYLKPQLAHSFQNIDEQDEISDNYSYNDPCLSFVKINKKKKKI